MTDITKATFLTVGLRGSHREPTDPAYARQQLHLDWDPHTQAEIYSNAGAVVWPTATVDWGLLTHAVIYAGDTEILSLPLTTQGFVEPGGTPSIWAYQLHFDRELLCSRFGGDGSRAITCLAVIRAHFAGDVMHEKVELTWGRRPRGERGFVKLAAVGGDLNPRNVKRFVGDPGAGFNQLEDLGSIVGFDYVRRAEIDAAMGAKRIQDKVAKLERELTPTMGQLFKQRYGSVVGDDYNFPLISDMKANEKAMKRARDRLLEDEFRREYMGVPSRRRDPEDNRPWVYDKNCSCPKCLAERVRAATVMDPGDPSRPVIVTEILPSDRLVQPVREKKAIVEPFWQELERALESQKPVEPKAISPTMPTVEATPAGAEELIDWLRVHPEKGWAERLSIPRVTRFLKEKEAFGMSWTEENLRSLVS